MTAALQITLTQIGPDLGTVAARIKNKRGLMVILGTEASNQFIANFRRLATKPNRLGAPSTHYYEGAADDTKHYETNDTATVSTTKLACGCITSAAKFIR